MGQLSQPYKREEYVSHCLSLCFILWGYSNLVRKTRLLFLAAHLCLVRYGNGGGTSWRRPLSAPSLVNIIHPKLKLYASLRQTTLPDHFAKKFSLCGHIIKPDLKLSQSLANLRDG
uniref:Uncharacterized protein n=1 Tax=Cacopsylla melanoneura TaxID=428564 RepID=A0A8D8YLB6_9HEMI